MINGKIIAVFAGFAAVITIIAGGIGGVSIPDIILRTILWSIVFAGIGTGISFIIGKYLPDAAQLFGSGVVPDSDSQGEFEAILPEENPHLGLRKGRGISDEDDFDDDFSGDEDLSADAPNETGNASSIKNASQNDASGFDTSKYDDRNLEDDSTGYESLGDVSSLNSDSLDDDEVLSGATGKNRNKGRETRKTAPVKQRQDDEMTDGFGEPISEPDEIESIPDLDGISSDSGIPDEDSDKIDSLPDIDSFSSFSSFDEGISSGDNTPVDYKPKFAKSKTNPEIDDLIQDPLKTAKAIHTWIEKDKEG